MARAQDARDVIVARLLEEARTRWPDHWRSFRPCRSVSPAGSATTWTGAPISAGIPRSLSASQEKAERLARYTASLEAIDRPSAARHAAPRNRLCRRPRCRFRGRSFRREGAGRCRQPADHAQPRQPAQPCAADRRARSRGRNRCARTRRCAADAGRCDAGRRAGDGLDPFPRERQAAPQRHPPPPRR
jgi:hypothetical protein